MKPRALHLTCLVCLVAVLLAAPGALRAESASRLSTAAVPTLPTAAAPPMPDAATAVAQSAAPAAAAAPATFPAAAPGLCLSPVGTIALEKPAAHLLLLPQNKPVQLQTCTYDDCEDQCTDCPWGCLPICLDVSTCECGCRC